jgi:multiple sugar transport system permease protein
VKNEVPNVPAPLPGLRQQSTAVAVPAHQRRHRHVAGWLEALPYLLPLLIGLMVFTIGPIFAALILSFTDWDLLTPPEWIGLGNYRDLFTRPVFWTILGNTLYYTVLYVPAAVVLPLLVAVMLNRPLRGIILYRGVYFLPVITSTVAIALVWMLLYQPEFGVLNYILKQFGVSGPNWLADERWAMPALVIMSVWKGLGFNMVIYLAGLQGISEQYYEAAMIEGANGWHRLRFITVPLISPTTFFVLIISIISSLQVFEQTYILTRGGPGYATLTMSYYIYQNAFQFQHMGFSAAVAYVLFVMIMLVTLVQFLLQRRWVFYQ